MKNEKRNEKAEALSSLVPLRTSSLFFKIFVLFWGAMTLAGIILLTLEAGRSEKLAERWRGLTGDAFATYAVTSAEAIEDKDEPPSRRGQKLKEYLRDLEDRARIRARLFDEGGREVSGSLRPVGASPDWLTKRIRQLAARARRTDKTEFEPLNGGALAARLAVSPSGRRYILVGELPAAHYGPWVAEPRVQALRLLAVLLMAALVSLVLARYLAAPIVKLRGAARRLTEGDLAARAGEGLGHRHDELVELAHEFDRMAERIESLLREQERLMASQRRLLGDVAHELRSPLARVSVALELARDSLQDDGERMKNEAVFHPSILSSHPFEASLDRIECETGRLSELIDRLLVLSRLESGVQKLEMTPVHLAELVRAVAADADFEARPHRRVVQVVACDGCVTQGSQDLLRSAIENVVRNAVRHTPENSTVEILLVREHEGDDPEAVRRWQVEGLADGCYTSPRKDEGRSSERMKDEGGRMRDKQIHPFKWAVIKVRDRGPGVPEAELGEVFRPFYRARETRDRQSGGVGLGLAITTRAVEFHGGQVRACNAPDGGLVIELRLPLLETGGQG